MNVFSTIKFIINHPLNRDDKIKAFFRFVKWQINTTLNPFPIIYPFTDRSKLIIKKGMAAATGNLYCGLHEFNDMCFLLHFLRENDLFIDIGANIGSYTILASGHVGASTISIEPVPSTFDNLTNNILINQIQNKVTALNIGLSSRRGNIAFTSSLDTVNHVAIDSQKDTVNINVETLDHILSGEKKPVLLKVDVEGFEMEVINGAQKILEAKGLKAIIIELNGSGARYGFSESKINEILISAGFAPFYYHPFARRLEKLETFGPYNTIYIRDIGFVEERLRTAHQIRILAKSM